LTKTVHNLPVHGRPHGRPLQLVDRLLTMGQGQLGFSRQPDDTLAETTKLYMEVPAHASDSLLTASLDESSTFIY